MKRILLLLLLLLLSIYVFAGGGAEVDEGVAAPATKEFTFDLYGDMRTVSVPVSPERIVVIGFDTLDIIDALGFRDKVVGVVDPKSPVFPYYLEGYDDVPSIGSLWGDDLESIAGAKPDLIIGSARTFRGFDALSEIAPAVYFTIPGFGSPFKDKLYENIESLAYLLGAEDAGEKLKEELDEKIDEVSRIISGLENPSALFIIVTGKTIGSYSDDPDSRYGYVFNEFGFKSVASAEEIKNDAAEHGESVSFEFISAKNPNYLLVIDRGAGTGETEVKASDTLDNVLVAETDAYKNGNILYLDAMAWYIGGGGVRSTHIMLDKLLDDLK